MADYKFEFTLSGANLSDEQKLRISNDIATAVTKAVVGDSPQLMSAPMFSACRINGGKIFIGAEAVELAKAVDASPAKANLSRGMNI